MANFEALRKARGFLPMVLVVLAFPCTAAVMYSVNSTDDLPADLNPNFPGLCHTAVGTCTLRAAIMQANRIAYTLGPVTITLPAGEYKLTIAPTGANDDASGDLNVSNPGLILSVSIVGAGAATTLINGNLTDRVFHVHLGRFLNISGATIVNGHLTGSGARGAGIWNEGTVGLSDVKVVNNHNNGGVGGGIYNEHTLSVINGTIADNTALLSAGGGIGNVATLAVSGSVITNNKSDTGGGISNYDSATATIIDSTLDHNVASLGGGIFVGTAATLTVRSSLLESNSATEDGGGIFTGGNTALVNATLSQNHAGHNGGALYNYSNSTNIYNTTIFFNDADADVDFVGRGGGIYNFDLNLAGTYMRNTLLAANYISNSPTYQECDGTVYSYGNNMAWLAGLLDEDGNPNNCNIPIQTGLLRYLDSLAPIGPLQDNGGPTRTHALLRGNSAIDFGDPVQGCIGPDSNLLPFDQRGFPRIAGTYCDVGAYEHTSLDIDNNGAYDPLTDGLLITRYLLGVTGDALTHGAIGANPIRSTPADILAYLTSIRAALDVDKNSSADPLTDGVLVLRHLFGLKGSALTAGAVAMNASRTGPQIEAYIQYLRP